MNISQLSSLVSLATNNISQTKGFIKLTSIDVVKSFGNNIYSVINGTKQIDAKSLMTLQEHQKYWANFKQAKNSLPTLLNTIKIPMILDAFKDQNFAYTLKELELFIKSKQPQTLIKSLVLEQLTSANTKDDFINNYNLLLSLQSGIVTLPMKQGEYFSILQFKKRYNKKTKVNYIDFYVALEFLGPISGVITLYRSEIFVNLNVAYEFTATFLAQNMKELSYNVEINVIQSIEPLYEIKTNSLLDINT